MPGYEYRILDLGRCPYEDAVAEQRQVVDARKQGAIADTLIFVEHDPVYTLGRSADVKNVTASAGELVRAGISVVKTGRGGDVTYHGPGQLVVYPIVDLGALGKGVVWYVDRLEEIMIRTLATYGVEGVRDATNRGVWVGDDKIGAIGVRVSRRISMHGFCLNVTVNLNHYSGIVPCGIVGKGVTSLDRLVDGVTMDAVKDVVREKFGEVMGGGESLPELSGSPDAKAVKPPHSKACLQHARRP